MFLLVRGVLGFRGLIYQHKDGLEMGHREIDFVIKDQDQMNTLDKGEALLDARTET